jgi:hypothetical protein
VTRCPQHLQLTVCRVPIREVKLNASRQSRRQPETALVRSERSQSGDLRRSALVSGRTCPPPSQPLPPIFFQRVHLYLMPILPVIAIEKQNARAGSRPIEQGAPCRFHLFPLRVSPQGWGHQDPSTRREIGLRTARHARRTRKNDRRTSMTCSGVELRGNAICLGQTPPVR